MRWPLSLKIPLARKISLLFAAAVLLVIIVTLGFPMLQMTGLEQQAMLLRAKRIATVAVLVVDLQLPDWNQAQVELERRWPVLMNELGLGGSAPRLVSAERANPGFQRDAIERLRAHPDQRYYWRLQDDGRLFRFAMAVRGRPIDPHPEAVSGIIDVRIPVQADLGVWNWVVTILAGSSGAVLAILVFYLVTQRLVLTPMQTLRRAAERVGAGDRDVRAEIDTGDEFARLAKAFNDMLASLKAAQEEQERINRSLDIRLGELAEVNVALYESSRLKSEFLTNVTHELRTPLVSIIGFAELLRDATEGSDADQQRLARYARNILMSGRSLLDLINDLLDLTKIEAGRLELHLSDFSLEELCSDLVDFVHPLADKREQKLRLEVEPGLPRCHSDAGRVKQILYNLLSNAIKFTPEGGEINLSAARDGASQVRLSVRDTGPGISEEDRTRIFEQFHQIDPSATREHTGTGLGLTITKELVELLGGTIELESEVGRGSVFTVRLPTHTPADRQERPRPKIKLT